VPGVWVALGEDDFGGRVGGDELGHEGCGGHVADGLSDTYAHTCQ
jgi:hypothetical protein